MKLPRNIPLPFLPALLILVLLPLLASTGTPQSSRRKQTTTLAVSAAGDIRRVDFLNFSCQPLFCSKDLRGLGRTVRLKRGNFQTDAAYFGVVGNRILYSDLTGDGREEAVIHIGCGEIGANFSLSEIFIYTRQNERTVLLADLNDKDMEADYDRFFPNRMLWRIIDDGVKVKNGNLIVQRFAEGSLSNPDYIVTLEYALKDKDFVFQGRPERILRTTKK